MNTCEHCGAETRNPRFCSNSCRASVTNRGVRRHSGNLVGCLNCRATVARRRNLYCSLECHLAAESVRHVQRWLATGLPGHQSLAGAIRDYLLMDQNGGCAICGMEPAWRGAPLIFVLDHIDGDATNHRRANVRMACPNCDSQLPTFKARNRGRGRHFRRERYRAGQSY
jgi:hypothetical protein